MVLVTIGLLSLPEKKTFKLEEFLKLQADVHSDLRMRLGELYNSVLSTVRAACDEVVDQFLKSNNSIDGQRSKFYGQNKG